ncbi:MAG: TraX family protein, partial [Pseudomonadota bacterium]
PLLAYLLVYNYLYNTRDKWAYIKRLFLFAILSQIPYMIAFENNELVLNIFFTLGVGLLLIYICEQWYAPVGEQPWRFLLVWATVSFIFLFFSVLLSYGPFGIFTIFAFYLYIKEKTTISLLLLMLVIYTLNSAQWHLGLALFGLLSLAIIWLVNSRDIQVRRVNKWLYYTFYPLHLIFIKVGMLIV